MYISLFPLLFGGLGRGIAQNNLVPNWSFENIQNFPPPCSSGYAPISDATGWVNPTNVDGPCIFNEVDTVICLPLPYPEFAVPSNIEGWQYAKTGKGYTNIQTLGFGNSISGSNVREYIQTQLIDSLQKNKTYCLSFFVSLEDSTSNYATSRIGCYFSPNAVSNYTQDLISVTPQVENPYHNFITSKTNWTAIQGTYTANGGENYITIGNFYNDVNTDTVFVPGMGSFWCCAPNNYLSAYYVDDVSLVEYSNAYAGNDTTVCKGSTILLGNGISQIFGANFTWSVLNGDSNSIMPNDTILDNFIQPQKTTTYVLKKQQCGIFSYDTLTIHIPISIIAKAGNDTTICIGDSALIGTYNACNWCSYNWQPVQSQNPKVLVYPHANTTYVLSVKDSCFTTYSNVTIDIDYCQSPIISVPNIFSPNGDGINDTWELIVSSGELSILNYKCTIYDRWGTKVFNTDNVGMVSDAWDGHTTAGIFCSEGAYYYVISYMDGKTNGQKNLKGFLELVR